MHFRQRTVVCSTLLAVLVAMPLNSRNGYTKSYTAKKRT